MIIIEKMSQNCFIYKHTFFFWRKRFYWLISLAHATNCFPSLSIFRCLPPVVIWIYCFNVSLHTIFPSKGLFKTRWFFSYRILFNYYFYHWVILRTILGDTFEETQEYHVIINFTYLVNYRIMHNEEIVSVN